MAARHLIGNNTDFAAPLIRVSAAISLGRQSNRPYKHEDKATIAFTNPPDLSDMRNDSAISEPRFQVTQTLTILQKDEHLV